MLNSKAFLLSCQAAAEIRLSGRRYANPAPPGSAFFDDDEVVPDEFPDRIDPEPAPTQRDAGASRANDDRFGIARVSGGENVRRGESR
jgi:hypothetical protein